MTSPTSPTKEQTPSHGESGVRHRSGVLKFSTEIESSYTLADMLELPTRHAKS